MEKKISLFWVVIIVLTAVLATFMTTFQFTSNEFGTNRYVPTPSGNPNGDYSVLDKVKKLYSDKYIGSVKTQAGKESDGSIIEQSREQEELSVVINAFIASQGDYYGEYYTAAEYAAFVEENSGDYCGIGVTVVQNTVVRYREKAGDESSQFVYGGLLVVNVNEASPAYGKIAVGDFIIRINGEDYATLGYNKTVSNIKGAEGESVSVTVLHGADYKACSQCDQFHIDYTGAEEKTYSIVRRTLESQTVYGYVENGTACIKITGFETKTAEQFTEVLIDCIDSGAEKFIFDMRDNPGGQLTSVLEVLSCILDYDKNAEKTALIRVEDKNGIASDSYTKESQNYMDYFDIDKDDEAVEGFSEYKNAAEEYKAQAEACREAAKQKNGEEKEKLLKKAAKYDRFSNFDFQLPDNSECVILVNSNTASAAELFTETLRDYGVAKVVGVTTYGKGSMQTYYYVSGYDTSMGVLKITANSYTSAYSESYNGIGIVPDVQIKLSGNSAGISLWLLDKASDAQYITAYNILNPDSPLNMPEMSEYNIITD